MGLEETAAELCVRRADGPLTAIAVHDDLQAVDVQIGSMFVTAETAKATLAPVGGHMTRLVVDGEPAPPGWDRAYLCVALARLSRWQWLKLVWAPTLRRISLHVWRDGALLRVRVHRWRAHRPRGS
jgi:hypothetical protein